MLNKIGKTIVFMGDLFPLFLIGAFLSLEPYIWYQLAFFLTMIALSLIGIVYWYWTLKSSTKYNSDNNYDNKSENNLKITKIEDRGSIYTIYMVAFVSIIPLIGHGLVGLISFSIIIIIVYSLYMNSDMLFYNPILALVGYKFYKFDLDNDDEIYALSKEIITKKSNKENLKFYQMSEYVYFVDS
jgi:hypothetical protein